MVAEHEQRLAVLHRRLADVGHAHSDRAAARCAALADAVAAQQAAAARRADQRRGDAAATVRRISGQDRAAEEVRAKAEAAYLERLSAVRQGAREKIAARMAQIRASLRDEAARVDPGGVVPIPSGDSGAEIGGDAFSGHDVAGADGETRQVASGAERRRLANDLLWDSRTRRAVRDGDAARQWETTSSEGARRMQREREEAALRAVRERYVHRVEELQRTVAAFRAETRAEREADEAEASVAVLATSDSAAVEAMRQRKADLLLRGREARERGKQTREEEIVHSRVHDRFAEHKAEMVAMLRDGRYADLEDAEDAIVDHALEDAHVQPEHAKTMRLQIVDDLRSAVKRELAVADGRVVPGDDEAAAGGNWSDDDDDDDEAAVETASRAGSAATHTSRTESAATHASRAESAAARTESAAARTESAAARADAAADPTVAEVDEDNDAFDDERMQAQERESRRQLGAAHDDSISVDAPTSISTGTGTPAGGSEAGTAPGTRPAPGQTSDVNEIRREIQDRWLHDKLVTGDVFLKHGRRGRPNKRFVWCSDDLSTISWREVKKKTAKGSIPVASLIEVRLGRETAVMRRSAKQAKTDCCLSVVAGDRTLDLELPTPADRRQWVDAFQYLVAHARVLKGGRS